MCNCILQKCFLHQNGLTDSTKILNLHLWSDGSLNETEKSILKIGLCTFKRAMDNILKYSAVEKANAMCLFCVGQTTHEVKKETMLHMLVSTW